MDINAEAKLRNDLASLWFPENCCDTDMQQKFLGADTIIKQFEERVAKEARQGALMLVKSWLEHETCTKETVINGIKKELS